MGPRQKSSISRMVMAGASSAWPADTVRTALASCSRLASLSRNPLAPAFIARYTYSSRLKVVSIRIRARQPARTSLAVASIPSSSGILMSISTTSGSSRRACASAWPPLAASPTTRRSGSASSIIRRPSRTRSWSSTIRTLITTAPAAGATERQPGAHGEPAAGPRPGAQLAAEHRHPLAHPGQPVPAARGPVTAAARFRRR